MKSKSKMLLASVSPAALTLMGGGAIAADLPVKALSAPAVARAFSWTGCYVGAHGGYGWGRNDVSRTNSSFQFCSNGNTFSSGSAASLGIDTSGGVYGGQVGCNYQFASNWVVGVEANFAGANIKGDVVDPLLGSNAFQVKTDFLGSAVARLGFTTFNNQGLFYVKGGLGAAHNKWSASSVTAGFNEDRIGWTVGTGYEWMFTQQLSGFVEYAHFDFGSSGNSFAGVTSTTLCFNGSVCQSNDALASGRQRLDVIKAGLNWKLLGP